ncbi:MAG: glycosyltransferase family 39 protein [Pseudomonadota bacterium]
MDLRLDSVSWRCRRLDTDRRGGADNPFWFSCRYHQIQSLDGKGGMNMKFFSTRQGMIVFVLGFLMVMVMAFCFRWAPIYDAAQYEHLGWNLSQGNGLSNSIAPPFVLTADREPLYPFFISIIYRIFGRHYGCVYIAQGFLVALSSLLTFKLAGRFFCQRIAFLAGILVAADPTISGFAGQFWTESLALFLLISFIYMMAVFKEERPFLFALSGGALIGLLTLCRAVFMLMPLAVAALLIFSKHQPLKKRLLQVVALMAAFTIIVGPWIYRNKKEFNVPSITTRSGHLLLWRALRTEYTPKDMLIHLSYGASDTLGRRLFPGEYSRMSVRGVWGPENIYEKGARMYLDYLARGYSEFEADRMLQLEAVNIIKKHPAMYVLQSFLELWKLSFFEVVPFAYSDKYKQLMQGGATFYVIGKMLRVGLRYYYSWLIIALAAVGLIRGHRSLDGRKSVFLLPIVYVIITAMPLNAGPRYLCPALPFIMIFAAAAFFDQDLSGFKERSP